MLIFFGFEFHTGCNNNDDDEIENVVLSYHDFKLHFYLICNTAHFSCLFFDSVLVIGVVQAHWSPDAETKSNNKHQTTVRYSVAVMMMMMVVAKRNVCIKRNSGKGQNGKRFFTFNFYIEKTINSFHT
jgi:hypothetical protein